MKNITMLLFVFISVVFIACGTPEPQSDQALTVESTETPHYIIAAVDTIGIELGDSNYVFGQTDAALFGTSGEILVLDGSKKKISVFSP
ncbi:MAG: hypothetical protein KAS73_02380, partial [Candidatus Sabulitectum sp.]|nr:hypothetical protein [Candidatus Sabulitectum sp.]